MAASPLASAEGVEIVPEDAPPPTDEVALADAPVATTATPTAGGTGATARPSRGATASGTVAPRNGDWK